MYFVVKNPGSWAIVKTPNLVNLGILEFETSNLGEAKEVAIEKVRIKRSQLSGRIKKLQSEIESIRLERKQLLEETKKIGSLKMEDIK